MKVTDSPVGKAKGKSTKAKDILSILPALPKLAERRRVILKN